MTFIEPKRSHNSRLWSFASFMAGAILVSSLASCVWLYAGTVNINHDISAANKKITALRSENAGLQNELFKMTDSSTLKAFAADKGLTRDDSPQWVFASL